MIRFLSKTAVLGTLATGTLWLTVGPDQIKDWVSDGKDAVQQQISEYQGMGAELRKVEKKVQKLDREIQDLAESAYKAEIDVKELEEDLDDRQSSIERLRVNLGKANALLGSEADYFAIGGIEYSRREVERDVQDKIELYKVQKSTLSHMRETLMIRRNALTMARENVVRGKEVRTELTEQVRLLAAKLKRYEARKIYSEAVTCDFDAQEFNTEIGSARKLLAQFDKKLKVKDRLLDEQLKIASESKLTGIDYDAPEVKGDLSSELSMILDDGRSAPSVLIVEKR